MVAFRSFLRHRWRVFHQSLLLDFQVRMPVSLGRRGYGLQHPHGPRKALSVLCPRMARSSDCDACDLGAAVLPLDQVALELVCSTARLPGSVSRHGRPRRPRPGLDGRVLGGVELADSPPLPPYWKFPWDSNPLTYYSLLSSSGSPLKSLMVAEAAVAAASQSALSNRHPRVPFV